MSRKKIEHLLLCENIDFSEEKRDLNARSVKQSEKNKTANIQTPQPHSSGASLVRESETERVLMKRSRSWVDNVLLAGV